MAATVTSKIRLTRCGDTMHDPPLEQMALRKAGTTGRHAGEAGPLHAEGLVAKAQDDPSRAWIWPRAEKGHRYGTRSTGSLPWATWVNIKNACHA